LAGKRKGNATRDPELSGAQSAQRAGDLSKAAELYRRVLQRRSRDAEALHGYGLVVGWMGHHDQAIDSLRKAVQADGSNAVYVFNLGSMLRISGETVAALECYHRASWLAPTNAEAHYHVGIVQEQRGDLSEAHAAIERTLKLDALHAGARTLALKLGLREGSLVLEDAQLEIRSIIAQGGDADQRCFAHRTAGDLFAKAGKHQDAFGAWTASNDATLEKPAPSDAVHAEYLARVDQYAQELSKEQCAAWRVQEIDDALPSPAMLVGFPRSGTTMTERMIDAHPGVRSIEERPYFDAVLEKMKELVPGPLSDLDRAAALTERQVRELRALYWAQVREGEGRIDASLLVLDKLPLRIIHLGVVNRIFPDAKILVALRDPRDVCLSCFQQRFAVNVAMSFYLRLETTAQMYKHVMGAWLATRDKLSLERLEVRYEDTVTDFEHRAQEIIAFLGMPWNDAVLRFHERTDAPDSATPSYQAVTKAVNTKAMGRWRNYETELAPVLPVLKPFVEAFGYEL
jgi:hypothetical protein